MNMDKTEMLSNMKVYNIKINKKLFFLNIDLFPF